MSDTSTELAEIENPPHLATLSDKQRRFVAAVVWKAAKVPEAAKIAGLGRTSAYRMFNLPAVRKAIDVEVGHLRASKVPRAIERLEELSEQDESRNAAFQASRYLAGEQSGQSTQINVGVGVSVGYVLDLSPQPPREPVAIDGRLTVAASNTVSGGVLPK